jgi:hypothetical protein
MSRLARAFQSIERSNDVRVVLDLNPDYGTNEIFFNSINQGSGSAQGRIRHHLAKFGISYFPLQNIDTLQQCHEALADYGMNNCGDGRILLMWDRRPVGLEQLVGTFGTRISDVVLC